MPTVSPDLTAARAALARHFGYAQFRPGQHRVVSSVLAGHDVLAVLPTGAGKSACFQVPALLQDGVTLVVSPLVSLMQDQVRTASARGLPVAALNSTMDGAAQRDVLERVAAGALRLLYVAPERLRRLADDLRARAIRPALLAVDEAHCIAEWGSDFRPAYRNLGNLRARLGWPAALALTGSATPAVRRDIIDTLGLGRRGRTLETHVGSFDRRNLWFGVVEVPGESARLAALLALLRQGDDNIALVYAPTRNTVEGVSRALTQAGVRAACYHAGLPARVRRHTLNRFLDDDLDVVVATCAFGMGIDKPDVRLVIHWTLPATPEAYYQEAGRAGRDGGSARCVILYRKGDPIIHRRQLEVTFPPKGLLERLWSGAVDPATVPSNVRAAADRLRRELRPELGPVHWAGVDQRRQEAEGRISAMERYVTSAGCRRRLLMGWFGEDLTRCAGCDRCSRRPPRPVVNPDVARRLRRLVDAIGRRRGPWAGPILEPEVMRRLATNPPADAGQLAAVPGVGAVLASTCGATILRALEVQPTMAAAQTDGPPLRRRMEAWRRRTAERLAIPEYLLLGDASIAELERLRPACREGLRQVPGIGPRFLRRFGDDLLAVIREPTVDPATAVAGPGVSR